MVIDDTAELFEIDGADTKEEKINKLKEIIIDAGISKQPELHNAVVDTLITNLNYLNQLRELGLEVPENYKVLDMETVTDEIGNKVPYQLALLKVHTVNGKQHLTILNQYFNSTVFFAETVDKDGVVEKDEILKQFYEQQRIMAAGDRDLKLTDLTEEDIIAIDRTDLLIDKVKKHSNDIVFVETIIRELNGTNETIVAHNGKRFDFNNYDVFLHNIGRRLLPNLYYRELTN